MATAQSEWRKIGDLSLTQFKQGIPASSPLTPELDSIYAAVKGYSALYKAHLQIENSWATTGNATTGGFNAQGSKDHTNGGYMRWKSWTEGAAWWKQHVLTYPDYQPTKTIADYVHVYAPWQDGNDETNYVNVILKYANQVIPSNAGDPPVVAPSKQPLTFGNVPKPPILDRIIPDSDNWAWNVLGQRVVLGLVYHTQVGTNWGTDGWFRTLWQSDGSKAGGQLGLTDFGVSRLKKNEILQWNDQLGRGRAGVTANRAPWASGPWENPPGGDGHAFVAKYGVNGINMLLTAIEIDQYYDTLFTKDGLDTVIWLSAWLADQAQVPYIDYPIFPKTGLTFTYTHNEFQNNKPCAGAVVIDEVVRDIIPGTADMLKHYQATTIVVPPVVTPPAVVYAKPIVPDFLKKYPFVQEITFNDVKAELRTDLMKATKDGVKFFQYGGVTSAETRPAAKAGETFPIVYGWTKDGQDWGLDPIGNRVLLANTTRVSEWTPQQVDAPASAYTAK